MNITPDKKRVVDFIEQAYEGKLCLPDFQREFVWRRDEVADLVHSILRGYFIGQLLLLPCDPLQPPFAPRALYPVARRRASPHATALILDGQQRMTSLLYALHDPAHLDTGAYLKDCSQHCSFFINLRNFLDDPDSDDVVMALLAREVPRELRSLDTQFAERIIPCSMLRTAGDVHRWIDDLSDWIEVNRPNEVGEFRRVERPAIRAALDNFLGFQISYNELRRGDKETEEMFMGQVCAIFEKLNSTGVELSVYDLLTARLYPHKIKLRELWDTACKGGPNPVDGSHRAPLERLNRWSKGNVDTHKFGVLALRSLALLRGLDPKPQNLINMTPIHFIPDWWRAVDGLERALQIASFVNPDGFGAFAQKWLPGFGLLPVLGALRTQIEEQRWGDAERADLRRWYWCSVFLERYSSAVESKSRKDYIELLTHWKHSGPPPALFVEAKARIGAPGYSVRDSASSSSSVYSGIFCLLAINGARDWRLGESIELQTLQDHHIFPQNYLKRHGFDAGKDKTLINSVLNRTLIGDETNNKIKDKAPADYLASADLFPGGHGVLGAHFLKPRAVEIMQEAKEGLSTDEVRRLYLDFIGERESAMLAHIRTLCGI